MREFGDTTHGVLHGADKLPTCARAPPGPHPTRNERPNDSPESMIASSWPATTEAELSTRAYFLDGLNGGGSISWANDSRYMILESRPKKFTTPHT